ncbi:MAG TPA: hypothetical protein VMM56_16095, partial [Planctomycetaceae bacterium]|nr:hypothetical protein [Planctomycetaceae bacterium]
MTRSTSSRWKFSSLRKLLPTLSGFGLGLLALHFVHSWISAFGVGIAAQSTAICCLGLGIWCASRWDRQIRQILPVWGSWLLCIALTGVVPIIVYVSSYAMRGIPVSWLELPIGQFLALLPSGLLLVTLPAILFLNGSTTGANDKQRGWGIAFGMGLGWLSLLPVLGVLLTLCLAAGLLCVCAGFEFWTESSDTETLIARSLPSSAEPVKNSWLGVLLLLGMGLLWPAATNIVAAWTLPSVWVLDARITAVVIGFALATGWTRSFPGTKGRSQELSLIALMLSAAILTGGQEAWMSYALMLHSNVTQPWLLALGRFLFVGFFPLVVGIALGGWKKTRSSANSLAAGTGLVMGGWFTSVFCLSQGIDPKWLICAGIGVMAMGAMISTFFDSEAAKSTVRWRWPTAIATVAGLACLASLQHSSILPARLIYSGFAKSEHRSGTDWELL